MRFNFTVKTDQYPFLFFFAVGYTDEEIEKMIKTKFKYPLNDADREKTKMSPTDYGYTYHFDNSLCMLRFNDFDDSPTAHGQLSHEISHAVMFMMEWIDTRLNKDTSEAYAYLDQYLTERFIKEARNAKDRRDKKRTHKK